MQRERRSKKRAELIPLPSPSKPKIQKRKVIIHESEEEEEEERPLKRQPRDVSRPQPPLASASTDPQDQVSQPEPNKPATANPAPQSPSHDAGVPINLSAG